ncbi:MAG: CPBP family intramembrane metalloprotease [bacterium]|nr:CPBP family intramembrane metalloprotease [bacterium]
MSGPRLKLRNPLLVVIWTFGLLVVGNLVLYPHFIISANRLGVTFGDLASGAVENPETILIKGLCGFILGLPLIYLIVRFLWRRSFAWVGLRFNASAFGGGTVLGLTSAALVIRLLILFGVARVTGIPSRFTGSELLLLLTGHITWVLFSTLLEEVIFRGMATREFALKWGWPVATVVGGIFFAACHLPGLLPDMALSMVIGLLTAGVIVNGLFVALYRRGGSLALPWGFHFGWNIALTALIGTVMSGEDRSFGLWHVEMSGSPLLSGGKFGPELSVIALLLMLFVTVAVMVVRVKGRVQMLPNDGIGGHSDDERPIDHPVDCDQ